MNIALNYSKPASNSLFELSKRELALSKINEDIATGESVRNAKDNPTAERISGQISLLKSGAYQALQNSEIAIEHIHIAESGIDSIENLLIRLKQLTVQGSNEAAYSDLEIAEMQIEIENIINQIKRLSEYTQYGNESLLNGNKAVKYESFSDQLSVMAASEKTQSSPPEGHQITVLSDATKASIKTNRQITSDFLQSNNFMVSVYQNGKTVTVNSESGDTSESFVNRLNSRFNALNINMSASLDGEGKLHVETNDYGSDKIFQINTNNKSVWSKEYGEITDVIGTDINAKINNTQAVGKGRLIIGREGTEEDGLKILFKSAVQGENGEPAIYPFTGYVTVINDSVGYQLGPEFQGYKTLNMNNYSPEALGRNVKNSSNIDSIAEIDVSDFNRAQNSLLVIDKAIKEVSLKRAEMGSFQNETVNPRLNENERLFENRAELLSNIRDTDFALKISEQAQQDIARNATVSLLRNTGNENMMELLS